MIAITLGDPAGVGPEILLKALPYFQRVRQKILIIGDEQLLTERAKLFGLPEPEGFPILSLSSCKIKPAEPTVEGYQAMYEYLLKALDLAKAGKIKGLVTLPICKEGLAKIGSHFRGHTELLASAFGVRDYAMAFYGQRLKVALLTTHLPLKEVPKEITVERVISVAKLAFDFLQKIKKKGPFRIALCGLNPHAGEGGVLGKEDQEILAQAVEKLKKEIPIEGPFPADSLFYHALQGKYDLVIANYHDQGLIPFKMLHFRDGVNLTLGLPIVRTSPCHGTAYDIAPLGVASPQSLIKAIKLALKLTAKC